MDAKSERLLLVEDHPDNLTVLTVMLSNKYEVLGYGSPVEALTAVEAFKPDLLVLDIGMGPMDGFECLEAIRGISGYDDIPAIALTAFARDVERKALFDAGFEAVVTKPIVDLRHLEAVIDALLAKSRALPLDQTHLKVA